MRAREKGGYSSFQSIFTSQLERLAGRAYEVRPMSSMGGFCVDRMLNSLGLKRASIRKYGRSRSQGVMRPKEVVEFLSERAFGGR